MTAKGGERRERLGTAGVESRRGPPALSRSTRAQHTSWFVVTNSLERGGAWLQIMASSFNPFRMIHTSHPSRHDMTRRVARELKALNFAQIAPNSQLITIQQRETENATCGHDWRSNSFASWRSLRKSGVTSCVLLSARHASTVRVQCRVIMCTLTFARFNAVAIHDTLSENKVNATVLYVL